MGERRGHWYLITGLILGAAVGLVYSWLISPVHYVGTAPSSLKTGFKDSYRILIAAAYSADGDIGRARARINLLHDPDPAQALAAQAQQILAQGGLQSDARQLAVLAVALGQFPSPIAVTSTTTVIPARTTTPSKTFPVTSTPGVASASLTLAPTGTFTPGLTSIAFTVTPSRQPSPGLTVTPTRQTGTPKPTLTPTATLGAPFALKERSRVCDQTSNQSSLQVQINDAAGNPVPGVEIQVTWQNGQDAFFTGFMPEINAGYATFQFTPGVVYAVHLTDGGEAVNDLAAISCTATDGQAYWGGWYLLFQQP